MEYWFCTENKFAYAYIKWRLQPWIQNEKPKNSELYRMSQFKVMPKLGSKGADNEGYDRFENDGLFNLIVELQDSSFMVTEIKRILLEVITYVYKRPFFQERLESYYILPEIQSIIAMSYTVFNRDEEELFFHNLHLGTKISVEGVYHFLCHDLLNIWEKTCNVFNQNVAGDYTTAIKLVRKILCDVPSVMGELIVKGICKKEILTDDLDSSLEKIDPLCERESSIGQKPNFSQPDRQSPSENSFEPTWRLEKFSVIQVDANQNRPIVLLDCYGAELNMFEKSDFGQLEACIFLNPQNITLENLPQIENKLLTDIFKITRKKKNH